METKYKIVVWILMIISLIAFWQFLTHGIIDSPFFDRTKAIIYFSIMLGSQIGFLLILIKKGTIKLSSHKNQSQN